MRWTYSGNQALASAATGFFDARKMPCRLSPYVLMTDPKRLPGIVDAVGKLPEGAALIYRHFGAPDKELMARRLRSLCFEREVQFLIGQDEKLVRECGADGLHLPERHLGRAKALRARYPDWIITCAAHSEIALQRAAQAGLDAAFVSPVFASESPSAGKPLGVDALSLMAASAKIPVFALGGINANNVGSLSGLGVAGIAGISGFVS